MESSKNINIMRPKINIKVDQEKGFYKKQGINKHEFNYLLNKSYKQISMKSCFSNSKKKYLLKPRFNESIQHFFLIMDISNYLKKLNFDVKLFITTKPDIIFKLNEKEIAIEVETGKVLKNNKKGLIEKVEMLNKNYANWFFILTNRNLTKKYKKYGEVVDKRYLKGYLEKLFMKDAEIY